MREIKFRGKDEDTGEWRYGGYHKHQIIEICPVQFDGEIEEHKTPKYTHYIIMDGFADWNMEKPIMKSNVIGETIGQYTGCKDNNDKEIYEGDILKFNQYGDDRDYIARVEFGNPNGEYNWGWQLVFKEPFHLNNSILLWVEMDGVECEVIGNIYENPDLLGE